MYKNVPFLPLAVIGIIVAALTAGQALLIDWLPPADSEQAERTFTLLWFLFWSSLIFFVIVINHWKIWFNIFFTIYFTNKFFNIFIIYIFIIIFFI